MGSCFFNSSPVFIVVGKWQAAGRPREGELFILQRNYYNRTGRAVYACAMDLSKAFDLVSWEVLFSKLLERGVYMGIHGYMQMILFCFLLAVQVFRKW